MDNNRLLQKVAVVVALMAAAVTSGVATASAPTGPERNVASSQCLAILRQELGTVMPSGWSGYQESDCSVLGAQPAALTTLDNPNGQWIGPETVSAALGQQSDFFPTTGGSGDLTSGLATLDNPNGHWIGPETVSAALGQTAAVSPLDNPNGHWIGPETVSAALGQQSDSFPTTGGSGDLKYGPPGR